MRILGIDPGSVTTGLGVIVAERGGWKLVAASVVRTRSDEPMGVRLARLHEGVCAAIVEHRPDECAIEEIFRHRSSESALRLGQARGVALLACARHGHEAHGYNPSVVKRSVGASGRAEKDDVARMVGLLLGVRLDLPADATDALAIAITHGAHRRASRVPLVGRGIA